MDIEFQSVRMNDTALTMDGTPPFPCLILQYDPPWNEGADGDHYHYMPIDALADAQLTFGVESDLEAVEFHVLNHAADAEVTKSRKSGVASAHGRQVDRGAVVRDLVDRVGDALMEEARNLDLGDTEAMMKSILSVSTEVGGGGFQVARSASTASSMAEARRNVRSLLLEDASMHSVNRKAKGYAELESILSENSEMLERSRERVLEVKYGRHLRKMIAVRQLEAHGNGREMTP